MIGVYSFVWKFSVAGLLLALIFDPHNMILGAKYPFFFMVMMVLIFELIENGTRFTYSKETILWVAIISVAVPIYTIGIGIVSGKGEDVFVYIPSYLFGVIVLSINTKDKFLFYINALNYLLTILAFIIVAIYIISEYLDLLKFDLRAAGSEAQVLLLGYRVYADIYFPTVFYKTSPMIVFAVSYWSLKFTANGGYANFLILLICVAGLFLSGTRANMLFAIGIPFVCFVAANLKNVMLYFYTGMFLVVLTLIVPINDILNAMFSSEDESNSTKIGYFVDYLKLFSNPSTLLFGDGLGSIEYWSSFGDRASITELTFLEIFRANGVFVGSILIFAITYPLLKLVKKGSSEFNHIKLGFGIYLIGAAFNPLLFSSSGFAIMVAAVAVSFNYLAIMKREAL
jgi:hypothetical protein